MMYDCKSPMFSELAHLLDIGYTDEQVIQERLMGAMEQIVYDTSVFYPEYEYNEAYQKGYDEGYKEGIAG